MSKLSFAAVEGMLAQLHSISDDKRVAFQGRLKALLKSGLLPHVHQGRGRAASYTPFDTVRFALALELTQLGLTPERAVKVLLNNWYPAAMAVQMATHWLSGEGEDPTGMFLYFDPAALSDLMTVLPDRDEDYASATFFYGGIGVVHEILDRWSRDVGVRRLALINVTTLLEGISGQLRDARSQSAFVTELREEAGEASLGDPEAEEEMSADLLGSRVAVDEALALLEAKRGSDS